MFNLIYFFLPKEVILYSVWLCEEEINKFPTGFAFINCDTRQLSLPQESQFWDFARGLVVKTPQAQVYSLVRELDPACYI